MRNLTSISLSLHTQHLLAYKILLTSDDPAPGPAYLTGALGTVTYVYQNSQPKVAHSAQRPSNSTLQEKFTKRLVTKLRCCTVS